MSQHFTYYYYFFISRKYTLKIVAKQTVKNKNYLVKKTAKSVAGFLDQIRGGLAGVFNLAGIFNAIHALYFGKSDV